MLACWVRAGLKHRLLVCAVTINQGPGKLGEVQCCCASSELAVSAAMPPALFRFSHAEVFAWQACSLLCSVYVGQSNC